ncbi:DUF222 domain-containing protein [Microbacterium sp. NPDC055903]
MSNEDEVSPVGQHMLLDDVVSTLQGVEQTIHQLEATRAALLTVAHRIADDDAVELTDLASREMAHRAVATEIGAALHVPDRTIEAQMAEAMLLTECFPATAAAFGSGRISKAHVRMILAAGAPIETTQGRAVFEEHVLARAVHESVNRVRPYAKQIAERVRGVSFQQRQDEARRMRQVWVTDEEDGESTLHVRGASTIIHGVHDRLTQMAHAVKTEDDRAARAAEADAGAASADAGTVDGHARDTRSLGELRSDLACDLLLTGVPSAHQSLEHLLAQIRAIVEITVPFLTIVDPLSIAPPAHLTGVGPIDPETARLLARDAPGWDRVMTDPVSGAVLATDRYRPTSELRRHLRSRDRRCRFMACNISARKIDDDHDVDWALGGPTDAANLSGKCRRHHMMKHHTPWTVKHLPGAVLEWTSPTGRVYTDRPPGAPAHVTFTDIQQRVTTADPWVLGDTSTSPF